MIEAIIAMVITGIVAGIVSVFMTLPITGYMDAVRRAEMIEIADLALRRMGYELRRAVPNSIRVSSAPPAVEFVPVKDGGRYRLQGPGQVLDGTATGDVIFDVLGPDVQRENDDYVVVFNTGQPGLDVYDASLNNRRKLNPVAGGIAGDTVSYDGNGVAFPPYASPSQRFQIAPKEGPVRYRCVGTELRRDTNYDPAWPPTITGLQSSVLATNVSCAESAFDYAPTNATNGLVSIRLAVKKDDESVMLQHQIHVDNTP